LTVTRPFKVSDELKRFLQAENLMGEPKYVLDEMTKGILSEARNQAEEAGIEKIETTVLEGNPARSIKNGVELLTEKAHTSVEDIVILGETFEVNPNRDSLQAIDCQSNDISLTERLTVPDFTALPPRLLTIAPVSILLPQNALRPDAQRFALRLSPPPLYLQHNVFLI